VFHGGLIMIEQPELLRANGYDGFLPREFSAE
jgi:hypothetical protein